MGGIHGRVLHRLAEARLGVLHVVLIESVVACHEHHHRFTLGATANPPRLLPEAHVAAGVARQDGDVECAHVDA